MHWDSFVATCETEYGRTVPEHWTPNLRNMPTCGHIRQGYYEYACPHRGHMRNIGFACKVRYYGIYARTVRQKAHALLAEVSGQLRDRVRRVRWSWPATGTGGCGVNL